MSQPINEPLAPLADEEAQALDLAMYRDKQARPGNPMTDGYEQRRQDRALRLQIQHQDENGRFV